MRALCVCVVVSKCVLLIRAPGCFYDVVMLSFQSFQKKQFSCFKLHLEQSFCAKYVIYIKTINLFKELSHLYVKNVSDLSSIIGLSFQFWNFIIVL